jgi:Phage virion morphogenesis family
VTTFTPTFTLDQAAWDDVRRQLKGMRERAQNVQPAWNAFLDWFAHGNRQQFGTQGKRWGTPWRELKPATVREKRGLGFTTDILVRESILLRSIADRPLNFERVGPHDMSAGTSVSYAAYHHRGAPRAGIPRRPLWDTGKIAREGAATSAIKSWIIHGEARVSARTEGR